VLAFCLVWIEEKVSFISGVCAYDAAGSYGRIEAFDKRTGIVEHFEGCCEPHSVENQGRCGARFW